MRDRELTDTLRAMIGAQLRLQARCEALDLALCSVARKLQLNDDQVHKLILDMTELVHQRLLESAEAVNPSEAAQIDFRKEFPDIPDHFL